MTVQRSDFVREATARSLFLASSVRIGVRSINDGIEGFTNVKLVCGPCVGVVGIIVVVDFVVGFRVGIGVSVRDICIGSIGVGAVDIVVAWIDSIGSGGKDPMGLGRTFTMCVNERIGCGIVWVVEFVVVGRLFCLKRPVLTKCISVVGFGRG